MKSLLWFLLGCLLTITGQAIATDYFAVPNGQNGMLLFGSDGSMVQQNGSYYSRQLPNGHLETGVIVGPRRNPCPY